MVNSRILIILCFVRRLSQSFEINVQESPRSGSGAGTGMEATSGIQLLHDVRDMTHDGPQRQDQPTRYSLAFQAAGEQLKIISCVSRGTTSSPFPDDAVFVAPAGAVADCDRVVSMRGLCDGHVIRWRHRGRPAMEDFLADPGPPVRGRQDLSVRKAAGCRYGNFGRGLRGKHYDRWVNADESSRMTAHYARITDRTVRRHWEAAMKGNIKGEHVMLDADGPLGQARWAETRCGVTTQTQPNGYCRLPVQKTCPHANAPLIEQTLLELFVSSVGVVGGWSGRYGRGMTMAVGDWC
ncbi:hypothetical protein OG285_06820 [Streptomyces sp. NBC_01471]